MVPNLPSPLITPAPGTPPSLDAEGAAVDFFAKLLGNGALIAGIVGQSSQPADEVTLRAAPPEGETEAAEDAATDGAATPDIIPLLQAQSGYPVAVAPVVAPANPDQPVPAEAAEATDQVTTRIAGTPVPQASPVAQAVRATIQAAQSAAIATPEGEQASVPNDLGPVVKAAVEAAQAGDMAGKAEKAGGVIGAAVNPVVGKLRGNPGVGPRRIVDPRAEAVQDKPAEVVVTQPTQRQPDSSAPRIDPVVQAAATTITTPVAPAFSTAPAAPQPAPAVAVPNAVPSVAELVVEKQLDLVNDNQWLDRLARDIARVGAGDEPLRFRLHPQTLGHLQVEVTQSDRGATVRLTADTEAARNILIDAQSRLAAEARAQGVRLAGTEVDLGTASQQGDARREAEARPQDIVRVVRSTNSDTNSSEPAQSRSDRYA